MSPYFELAIHRDCKFTSVKLFTDVALEFMLVVTRKAKVQ